jgi:hypothetical protein
LGVIKILQVIAPSMTSNVEIPIAPFTIQRRATTPFAENKYFTEAPLRSEEQFQLIEQFERDVIAELPEAILAPDESSGKKPKRAVSLDD